jgi:oligopeptide/dipeptide ABC transporter ATP-binding protein
MVPSATDFPSGCRFRNRCDFATDACGEKLPELEAETAGHAVACLRRDAVRQAATTTP